MNGKKILLFICTSLILAWVPYACARVDTLPQLEILVLDEKNEAIPGAYVALFDTADEWNSRMNPVQVWRRTDSEGKVWFIDLREIAYYIYARFDGRDNSVGEISTAEELQMNKKSVVIIHLK